MPDPEAYLGHRGLAEARAGLGGICRDPEAHISCAEEVRASFLAVCSLHSDIKLKLCKLFCSVCIFNRAAMGNYM